jgi:hypothetical protein
MLANWWPQGEPPARDANGDYGHHSFDGLLPVSDRREMAAVETLVRPGRVCFCPSRQLEGSSRIENFMEGFFTNM